MLISEFAKAAGLPVDTVRFYIKKGLLAPVRASKSGARPYQIFSEVDVTTARMIRLQQFLGYSLHEIAQLNDEYRLGAGSTERTAEVLRQQISRLDEKKNSIDTALSFLREKLEWVQAGKPGAAPQLEQHDSQDCLG